MIFNENIPLYAEWIFLKCHSLEFIDFTAHMCLNNERLNIFIKLTI